MQLNTRVCTEKQKSCHLRKPPLDARRVWCDVSHLCASQRWQQRRRVWSGQPLGAMMAALIFTALTSSAPSWHQDWQVYGCDAARHSATAGDLSPGQKWLHVTKQRSLSKLWEWNIFWFMHRLFTELGRSLWSNLNPVTNLLKNQMEVVCVIFFY